MRKKSTPNLWKSSCQRPTKNSSPFIKKLESHYRDMQDIEFTIERGVLWMLELATAKEPRMRRFELRVILLTKK